jgi:hypothetical protein
MTEEYFEAEDEIFDEANAPIDLAGIRRGLESIAEKVAFGQIGRTKYFQGADVVIASAARPNAGGAFSDYLEVITQHPAQVSWLFFQLRDCFESFCNFQNKFWFYGTLAEATKVSIGAQAPAGNEDLLTTIEGPLRAAFHIHAALVRSSTHCPE